MRHFSLIATTGSQAPAWKPNDWQAPACRSVDHFQTTLIFARQSFRGSAFPGVSLATSVLRGGDQREVSKIQAVPLGIVEMPVCGPFAIAIQRASFTPTTFVSDFLDLGAPL
ncbi:hypothetical protein Pla52n_57050 [Stieleria varia]|uniref:Uncharacterized protein n=1 Tax=Stieleria varia TaxID=2528005 RepID=A0A5C6A3G1_9BACT|nr:hypothetical protein Pla52n_57050 [Stieleria varia]